MLMLLVTATISKPTQPRDICHGIDIRDDVVCLLLFEDPHEHRTLVELERQKICCIADPVTLKLVSSPSRSFTSVVTLQAP